MTRTFCYHCDRYVTEEKARLHLALARERIEAAAAERERGEEDDE